MSPLLIAFVALVIIGAIIYYNSKVTVDQKGGDIAEEDYWFGIFYVNPNDRRLFIPKRLDGGFNINLGNPVGVVIAVGIFLLIVWLI